MSQFTLDPVRPYSLLDSARWGNPSRKVHDGVVETVFTVDGAPAAARIWQRRDGSLGVDLAAANDNAALDHLRFLLAVDVDHRPFLEMVSDDPLLSEVAARSAGVRPMRVSTVAHAALQAIAGQLITTHEARMIEQRVMTLVCATHAGLRLPPRGEDLRRLSAAKLTQLGLAPRRAAALARLVRTLDLERLRTVPTPAVVARIERERTLGPWSAGVVALYGLGRYEHGMAGDLGLVRLCSALLGRTATTADTQSLLDRYGEWAGLASVYLLRHPLARQRLTRAA
jgi:3-methyladenine DNA glycosylase/8-oxoguanine DNA glycosylase